VVGFAYILLVNSSLSPSISSALVTNYPLAMFTIVQQKAPVFMLGSSAGSSPYSLASSGYSVPVYSTPPTSPYSTPIPSQTQITVTTTLSNGTQTTAIVPSANVTGYLPALDNVISYAWSNPSSNPGRIFLIGHCVWSWLIALCAAWFAGRMYARRLLDSAEPLAV
jgi:hypothetical protein